MKTGWEIKRLGDVCDTGAGGTPLKAHKDYYEGGDIPWLQSGEVSQGEIYKAKNFITEKGLKNSSARLFPKDTVLVAMYGATAGQVGILRFAATTNQAVCGIFPNDKTIPEYLFYCFLCKKEDLISQAVGGAQPNISQIKIKDTRIPLPPLHEQRRIVAILDEAFAAIAKAKENAEKNLANAREVFESYLQSVFANPEAGWEKKKLCEVAEFKGGGTPSKAVAKYWNGTIPWVSPKDMKYKEIFDAQDHISVDAIENSSTSLVRLGSILIVVRSGILAHTVPLAIARKDVTINQDMKALIPKKEVEPEFLYYHLSASHKVLLSLANRGATVHRLPSELLETLKVLIPPLQVQKAIVTKLDSLTTETQKLETIYKKKLANLDELKKSILEKAFAGEL